MIVVYTMGLSHVVEESTVNFQVRNKLFEANYCSPSEAIMYMVRNVDVIA